MKDLSLAISRCLANTTGKTHELITSLGEQLTARGSLSAKQVETLRRIHAGVTGQLKRERVLKRR